MDEQKLRTFNAISSFVQDLDTGFGKKYRPVALYNRLVSKTTLRDEVAINRHLKAFEAFFNANSDYVNSKTISEDARVKYSDRVYLDIGRILSKIDDDSHKQIHQHLITIFTLMNIGTPQGREALETLKQTCEEDQPKGIDGLDVPDTKEGQFIKNTFSEMMKFCDNGNMQDVNPMSMITGMMQSNFFGKFMSDLQSGMASGDMNMQNLMTTVTKVISGAAPAGSQEADQIKSMMTQMTNIPGISGAMNNPEIQNQLKQVLEPMGISLNGSQVEEVKEESKSTFSDVSEDDAEPN